MCVACLDGLKATHCRLGMFYDGWMDAVVVLCVLDTSLHGQCLFYRCSPVIDPRLGLPLQRWDVSLIVFLAGLFSACYYILLESNPHFGYDICCSAVANKNSQTYRHL